MPRLLRHLAALELQLPLQPARKIDDHAAVAPQILRSFQTIS